jgi:hypothetical protein
VNDGCIQEVDAMGSYGSMSGKEQDAGQRVKEEARQKGQQAVEQVKQSSADAMEQARESTRAALDSQKGRAAEGLGSVASALRSTGRQLNDQGQDAFGQYAERAAEKVDAMANQLRNKGVDELVYEAERFARREPELFLGGAVVLGLLAARFLKASNSRRREMRDYDWQRTYGTQGGYGQTYGGATYRGEEGLTGRPYGSARVYGEQGASAGQSYGGQGYRGAGFSSGGTEDFGYGTEETGRAQRAGFERSSHNDEVDEAGNA